MASVTFFIRVRRPTRTGRSLSYHLNSDNLYVSSAGADVWWDKIAAGLARSKNLTVIDIPAVSVQELASLSDRNMQLQCLIQDGQAQLMSAKASVSVAPMRRMGPTAQVY